VRLAFVYDLLIFSTGVHLIDTAAISAGDYIRGQYFFYRCA
jgi:hypothetical protein